MKKQTLIVTLLLACLFSSFGATNIFVHAVNNIIGWDYQLEGGFYPPTSLTGNVITSRASDGYRNPYEFYGDYRPQSSGTYTFSIPDTGATNIYNFDGVDINIQIVYSGQYTNRSSWRLIVSTLPDYSLTNYISNEMTSWPADNAFAIQVADSNGNPDCNQIMLMESTPFVLLTEQGFHGPSRLWYRIVDTYQGTQYYLTPWTLWSWPGSGGVLVWATGDFFDVQSITLHWMPAAFSIPLDEYEKE